MGSRKKLLACAAAAATSVSLLVSGGAVGSAAHAADPVLTPTDYGFKGHAYGSRVVSQGSGLESGRTAFSWLSCTRIAGLEHTNSLASVQLPDPSDPIITVSGVQSRTRTFKDPGDNIAAAMESSNSIAHVRLGSSTTPSLSFDGLTTRSRAWATTGGQLKAWNRVTSGTLAFHNPPTGLPPELQDPIDQLVAAVNEGIGQVMDVILENGNLIVIPGLGEVSVGHETVKITGNMASARSSVLRVRLYGADAQPGGNDDTLVGVGRSWAQIMDEMPAAVMTGVGYGASASVLDGALGIGKVGEEPLPCPGTYGRVLSNAVVSLAPGDAPFSLAGVRGRSFGEQYDSGAAKAWVEGGVANLQIGPLEIRGIVGRVNLKQDRRGKMVTNNFNGSSIGEIIVDGESQGGFTPGEASEIPTDQLPEGVAKIELFERTERPRGGSITAVVVTFAEGTPGYSTLRLGVARANLARY